MKKTITLLSCLILFAGGEAYSQCLQPTSLTASNLTTTSATVGWTGTSGAYDVEIVPGGSTASGVGEAVFTNSKTFTGLNPNTTYDVYVRSNCDTVAPLILTGIFDGPLTGGLPKVIEVYAMEAIPDLSVYGVGSASNGGGTDGVEFTFPSISVPAGTPLYITTDSAAFNQYFGINAHFIHNVANNNGDDAVELFRDSVVIDVFGDISWPTGTGPSLSWNYLDGWAYRNNGTTNNQGNFHGSEWTYSGMNATDACLTNLTCASQYPIGTYTPPLIPGVSGWAMTSFSTCGLLTNNYTITEPACFGDPTGSATVTSSGGTGPYTYTWPDGSTGATQNNLNGGTYNVMISYAGGCNDSIEVIVTQPALLTGNATVISDVTCFGQNDGQVTVNSTGGTSPYNYSWNGGAPAASPQLQGVTAGPQYVTVTDDNGCTFQDTVVVTEPADIVVGGSVVDNSFYGSVSATVSGGVTPYNYSWTGPSGFTGNSQVITGLSEQGTYFLTVVDANGCSDTMSFVVAGTVTVGENTRDEITVSPNPSTGIFNINNVSAETTQILVSDVTGKIVYSVVPEKQNLQIDLSGFGKGLYFISLNSASGRNTIRVSVY